MDQVSKERGDEEKSRLLDTTRIFLLDSLNLALARLSSQWTKMITVAVAGGIGNIGRTIAEVLKEHPDYQVVVLARKVSLKPSRPLFPSVRPNLSPPGPGRSD